MYYFIKIFATAETDTDQWVVSIILWKLALDQQKMHKQYTDNGKLSHLPVGIIS